MSNTASEETRFCKNCKKTKPHEEFMGMKDLSYVKTCKTCREIWKRNDKNRNKERRNELSRVCAKKPENIARKKAWENANPEKIEQKCKKSRAKRATQDIEGFLKHNAEVMKQWRERNPDKIAESNKQRRKSVEAHYKVYKRCARLKRYDFLFTESEFNELVKQPCFYCGEIRESGFHGIDRMDASIGYIQSNCVSCCQMCNWMKGCVDSSTFIKRIRHILSIHNRQTPHEFYPECFPDSICVSYASYRSRAQKKTLDFEITPNEYAIITTQDCYLCGKQTVKTHKNGIDRIDNTIGYVLNNCRACCRECNHMKKDFELSHLFEKMNHIRSTWANKPLPDLPVNLHIIQVNKNKMTKTELMEERTHRKEKTIQKHQEYLVSIE